MLPISTNNLSSDKRELLRFYADLSDADKQTLLAFAEFLNRRSRHVAQGDVQQGIAEALENPKPRDIPRPDKESVVAAMRRLSKTYFMLNKDELLHKASDLMSAHIMHGKSAVIVIDELEVLFAESYTQQFGSEVD